MIAALVLAQCFVLDDPSPGWKQITLPADAPQLAAPAGYEQLRAGEPVVVTHELDSILTSSWRSGPGTWAFSFALPPGAQSLELHFASPLDGAKVDAAVEGPRGKTVLLSEKRIGADQLHLELSLPDATHAVVSVHSHLRGAPTLASARAERTIAAASNELPPQLLVGRSLYVLKPAGPLTLCQDPTRRLELNARSLMRPLVTSALARRSQ